ncbi:unnamed protein product [Prorocentrum cordatum]|uniref:N-acetyltransferase domain-containing protein n=1 Tax=Prorocentrum cordatum TaxID=2364126 RepID=A0ABN9TI41_9DINO|nr:unnamed protein product [Polarella glacialis]
MLWPRPAPLEGVKSRARAVFELRDAVVRVGEEDCCCGQLDVTLQSRAVAVGDAGRALTSLLLGHAEPKSGLARRHEQLKVCRLGPDMEPGALDDALRGQPHVVVLEEGPSDDPWRGTFAALVAGQAVRHFEGAVVVIISEEMDQLPRGLCSCRCTVHKGQLRWDHISTSAHVVSDLCEAAAADASYEPLLKDVSRLSKEFFADFGDEDPAAVRKEAAARCWTVLALAASDPSGGRQLLGFATYSLEPTLGGIYLARVAVPEHLRNRGYASQLVRALVAEARTAGHAHAWIRAGLRLHPERGAARRLRRGGVWRGAGTGDGPQVDAAEAGVRIQQRRRDSEAQAAT